MKNVSPEEVRSFRNNLLSWAEDNLREYPWRKTDSPYHILVAEILLQQTFADKVVPVYEAFVEKYPNLETLAEAEVSAIASLLEPLGLQNVRAQALINIANKCRNEGIPDDEKELLQLPYVGPYAANATLCFAFDRRRPVVDANVVRIYNRAFGVDFTPQDDQVWMLADQILSDEDYQRFNLALIDFGAKVCSSNSPLCAECFYQDQCAHYSSTNRS